MFGPKCFNGLFSHSERLQSLVKTWLSTDIFCSPPVDSSCVSCSSSSVISLIADLKVRSLMGYVFAISRSSNHCSSLTSYMNRWWIETCEELILFSLTYQHQIANINPRRLCLKSSISINFHFNFCLIIFSFDLLTIHLVAPSMLWKFVLNLPTE